MSYSALSRGIALRLVMLLAVCGGISLPAFANSIMLIDANPLSYTGSGHFESDDDMVEFRFTLTQTTDIQAFTTSWASGVGGFEPILTLYQGTGSDAGVISTDFGGTLPDGCGARAIDSQSGYCLDAYLGGTLEAGDYTLVLTQYDNFAAGTMLGDGFVVSNSNDGLGNPIFTGLEFGGGESSFWAFDGSQRTNNWEAQIVATTGVPEPGTVVLLMTGLAFLGASRRKLSSR